MSKRKRLTKVEPAIKSDMHADRVLNEIIILQDEKDALVRQMNAEIEARKEDFLKDLDRQDKKINRRDIDIKEYIECCNERGEFAGAKRSRKLGHGVIGMRLDPPSITPVPNAKIADAIIALLKAKKKDLLTFKPPVLDKEALLKLGDEALAKFKLRKAQKDRPFYELPDHAPEGNNPFNEGRMK